MKDSSIPTIETGCADLLTTGDMARLSDSTLRTVRFYQQEGLIEPERRSNCGHRLFSGRELMKLQLALDLREAGLSLHSIKDLFCLKLTASQVQAVRKLLDHYEQYGEMIGIKTALDALVETGLPQQGSPAISIQIKK